MDGSGHKNEALARGSGGGKAYVLAAEGSGDGFGLMGVEARGKNAGENLLHPRVELMRHLGVLGVATWQIQRTMDRQARCIE